MFRLTINDAAINKCGPDRYLFVDFVLLLPQNILSRLSGVGILSIAPTVASLTTPTQKDNFEDFTQ